MSKLTFGVRSVAVIVSSILVACSGAGGPDDSAPALSSPAKEATAVRPPVAAVLNAPTPLASVTLANDHRIEFHDFGTGAFVLETGDAETVKPTLRRADTLVGLFEQVAPGRPVPDELVALQARLIATSTERAKHVQGPALEGDRPRFRTPPPGSISMDGGKIESGTCGNNCCNATWLHSVCDTGYEHDWFLLNFGWSVINGTGITGWTSDVCAATGTSNLQVIVAGDTEINWNVTQGHFARFIWWDNNLFGAHDIYSNVNNSAHQAAHTYCGTLE